MDHPVGNVKMPSCAVNGAFSIKILFIFRPRKREPSVKGAADVQNLHGQRDWSGG